MRTWNSKKLLEELTAAGLPAVVAGSDGTATFSRPLTAAEAAQAAAIVAAHDPVEYGLSPDLQVIRGNGVHAAVVEVRGSGDTAILLVNGITMAVELTGGRGALELVSDTPGATITVTGATGGLAKCQAVVYVV